MIKTIRKHSCVMIPTPDSMLRVFMLYKALAEKRDIPKQEIPVFERKGFSVIEWGGAEI
jgi:hypothetical protein